MSFFSKEFGLKYLFRFLHISPVVFLGGKIAMDFLFPTETSSNLSTGGKVFYAFCGVSLIIAGFINIFLLKTKEKLKDNNKLWMILAHSKLLLTIIFFTPLAQVIMKEDKTRNLVQFLFLMIFLIVSPFMRFYREYYTEFHRNNNMRINSNPDSSSNNQIFVFLFFYFPYFIYFPFYLFQMFRECESLKND